ncbi:hypothetical protein LV82_01928 [Albidovulum inexpectatum]|uniref:Uncharacterized protein n=1 Tax=Albidovulum inexpectatum TaxID=196587 RepID=A0A2S5JGN0_9RHOB|nr:hypothetical protein [Albidovulum inexpectatum]PPB80579.1 hypothetical protein LV82_01928 [Albidovulum inexpectatum]
MQYDWILDVLADLRGFARMNGLAELADHLDQATLVALDEMRRTHGAPTMPDAGLNASAKPLPQKMT